MKLLRYLSKKTTNNSEDDLSDEEEEDSTEPSEDKRRITFSSPIFISNLKKALLLEIEERNAKYVKNCLKFINIRCSNLIESLLYYDEGFSNIFIDLPDEFMYYISLIYMGFFKHIPESINDMDFLDILIEKLDIMAHNGIYSNKVASVNLISKIIFKKRDLSQNQAIINIVFDSLDLLLSSDLETLFRFLDLLIRICQWERNHNQRIVIDGLIARNIGDLFDEIAANITELDNERSSGLSEIIKENHGQNSSNSISIITSRIQELYNAVFQQDEEDDI